MSKQEPKQKATGEGKTNVTPLMTPKELKEANERADKILSDSGTPDVSNSTTLAPAGMEEVGEQLTDDQILVLNAILSDVHPEPEEETKPSVYRRLHAAFKRSGLGDTKPDEIRFYNILKDPKFGEIVKVTGRGVIGTRIVAIADKMVELALAGDKTAIKWALEMFKLKKSKYDYYMESANQRRPSVEIGEINFGGMSDAELKEIRADLLDVTDQAEITG